jgi:hypothetical protein
VLGKSDLHRRLKYQRRQRQVSDYAKNVFIKDGQLSIVIVLLRRNLNDNLKIIFTFWNKIGMANIVRPGQLKRVY